MSSILTPANAGSDYGIGINTKIEVTVASQQDFLHYNSQTIHLIKTGNKLSSIILGKQSGIN